MWSPNPLLIREMMDVVNTFLVVVCHPGDVAYGQECVSAFLIFNVDIFSLD